MDRRDFLRKSATGTLGLTLSPALFNSCGTSASKGTSSDRLQLSFKPYDLKLKHAFNLAKSSRTHTPDVQVQLRFGEWTGYGEAPCRLIWAKPKNQYAAFLDNST